MPRNFYIAIFIMLCIAISTIGISFLNRISNNYFQLRKELNYPNRSMKYSLDKNKAYSAEKFGAQAINGNVSIAEKVQRSLQLPVASSLKTLKKFNKRNKRQAITQKSDFYSWNVNIDISPDSNYPVDDDAEKKSDSPLKSENLRVSFRVKNKTADEPMLAETDNAAISIQALVSIRSDVFQSLLKSAKESERDQQIVSSQKENSNEYKSLPTDSVTLVSETNLNSSSPRGREGKFILDFLGFRSKTRGETTTLSEMVTVSTDDSSLVVRKNELLEEENVKSSFGKESSPEITTTSEIFRSAVTPTVNLEDIANVSQLNFREISEHDECLECVSESLEPSTMLNEQKSEDIFQGKLNTRSSFTNEMLERFCMNLVNKLEDQLQVSDEKNELDPELLLENDNNRLKSLQNLSIPEVQNSLTSIEENDSSEDPAVLEDSFLVSDESELQNSRQSKFFDLGSMLGFGSGRGRSAFSDESDLISEGFDLHSIEENIPTIEDCENFFREKQAIIFTKPNLMDMISDPKIDLMDFANGTISPKLKEHQLQLLTDHLQNSLNNTIETSDNLENTIETPESAEKFSSLTENEKNLDREKIFQTTSTLDWNGISQGTSTDFNIETDESSDTQRDGRFINTLGFGSGRDENIESSDSGRFLNIFASGERSLDTMNIEIARNELGSGEVFEDTILSNDVRAINISEEGMFQEFSTAFDQESKFFNLNLFEAGSGNGRELTEDKELSASESISFDDDCENDCTHEVTHNSSYDCRDCDYSLEKQDIQKTFPRNESECDDCNLEITYEGYNYDTFQTSSTEVNKFEKDLAASSHTSTESNEPIQRYQTEEILDVIKSSTESSEIFEDNDLVSENIIPGKENFQELSIIKESSSKNENECNDCNPEVTYDSYGYDDLQKNSTEGISFQKDFTDILTESDEPFPIHPLEEKLNVSISATESFEIDETECLDCNYDNEFNVKNLPEEENFQEVSIAKTHSSIESITITADSNLFNVSSQTQSNEKVENNPKIFGTIFLTGSGDGGPINLVEETTVISRIPGRGGRVLDDIDLCDDCNVDFSEMFENEHEDSVQTKNNPVKSSSFPTTPKTPKRFGEAPVDEREAVILNGMIPTSVPSVTVTERTKKRQHVFCTSARECNNTLNERCVAVNASSICACSRGYVRHRETNKCVAMRVVETSLKFPAETFDKDLENPFSPRFQRVKNSAEETMWLLLRDMPELFPLVAEVDAIKFKPGSLIVSWNIILAVENESEMKLISNLDKDLQKAIQDIKFNHETALNMRDASVLPIVSAINPCQSSELNYCSKNAYCVSNEDFPGRFSCYCKEHYRDVSTNPLYVGETCIDICPPEYCGPYGHCENLENGNKHCLCSGLNFGRRCEIPGIVVFSILGVAACMSIAVLLVVAFRKRCRTIRYGGSRIFQRSQETNTHLQIDGRLSDEIALGENVGSKVTKFTNISTPLAQIPAVKVTRPTFNGSSPSYYDFDSTFDVSPDRDGSNPEIKSTV